MSKPSAMGKIWSKKKEQQEQAKAENADIISGKKTKVTAAQLRVQKDLSELELGATMKTEFPDHNDILNFVLEIKPDEGPWQGGVFTFTINVGEEYPHKPPKVLCQQKIYHPNIDLEGKVCLNILREDWKPVLNLTSVVVGLLQLFLAPNPDDPLNKEAAEDMRNTPDAFEKRVMTSMAGNPVRGQTYDCVLIGKKHL
ncbi:ubiquitin-conjugating enzyme [Xylariomycetidae sp. FL0641]|nr:ubiquitin-conjugating enzyme [Xylariomycetidae sp. FL0641]